MVGCEVKDLGVRVWGKALSVWGSGFGGMVWGLRCRVWDEMSELRVSVWQFVTCGFVFRA